MPRRTHIEGARSAPGKGRGGKADQRSGLSAADPDQIPREALVVGLRPKARLTCLTAASTSGARILLPARPPRCLVRSTPPAQTDHLPQLAR
jgi:hypothetical protein